MTKRYSFIFKKYYTYLLLYLMHFRVYYIYIYLIYFLKIELYKTLLFIFIIIKMRIIK